MSWDPKNLQNLLEKKAPDLSKLSVYQQRWAAKRELRAYHGPNIDERQLLDRHFTTRLPVKFASTKEREQTPPIQALAFAELERRLDFIVFRSHFSSSLVKARAAVTAGLVKVNGEKCLYPARRLDDGDLVTVCPSVIPTLKGQKGEPREFEPVEFMGPWMFIPDYLEVDYNTCSTVFLRSPLTQPNRMEIPSPLPPRWHQLAFEWYATIKRKKSTNKAPLPLVVNGQYVKLKPKFDSIVRRMQKQKL